MSTRAVASCHSHLILDSAPEFSFADSAWEDIVYEVAAALHILFLGLIRLLIVALWYSAGVCCFAEGILRTESWLRAQLW
jgi:hypothetical protein